MNGKPRNRIEERFDRESPAWREIYRRSGRNPFAYHDKQYRRRYVLEMLGKGSGRVLDLGCGAGEFFVDLGKAGYSVVGADFSSEMVRLAAAAGGAAPVVRADAVHPPFAPRSFRALIAVGLLEYLPEDGGALAELRRIMEPGGVLVVTLRNRRCLERRLWDACIRRGWMKRISTGFFREHDPDAFEAAAAHAGFTGFSRRYCHFYPLPWPLSKFLAPVNNVLAHLWERIFSRRRIPWLASTVIVSFRVPGG
ncbi:MAG: methyltransferase domain-containing protein [Anaerolineales bacterium]|nr:methyltransferase domain-containing protein [Anaerolineales bacterium]